MNRITVHQKKFRKFISSAKIQKAVYAIANKIDGDFKNDRPVFLSVLNGSFLFTADLLKKVKGECEVSFVKLASYSGTKSTGKVSTLIGLNGNFKGRTVIILEDIVDSGKTLAKLMRELKKHRPARVKVAALFFKPDAYKGKIQLDYIGIEVPDKFLLGYGLDYNGLGRNLQDVYILDL